MLTSCTLPWTKSTSSELNSTISGTIVVENDRDDSAFHEPEYSNPASFESHDSSGDRSGSSGSGCSPDYQNQLMIQRQMKRMGIHENNDFNIRGDPDPDFIPDYEEVDPVQVEQLRRALKRNSFHKEVVNTTFSSSFGVMRNEKNADNSSTNKERIMQALIYCIHKVCLKSRKNNAQITKILYFIFHKNRVFMESKFNVTFYRLHK